MNRFFYRNKTRISSPRLAAAALAVCCMALAVGCENKSAGPGGFEQPTQPTAEERQKMQEAMRQMPGVGQ